MSAGYQDGSCEDKDYATNNRRRFTHSAFLQNFAEFIKLFVALGQDKPLKELINWIIFKNPAG
jgi:hypothetical protein